MKRIQETQFSKNGGVKLKFEKQNNKYEAWNLKNRKV